MATPPPINGDQFFLTNSLATLATVDTSKPGMTDGALIFVVTEKTLYEFSKSSTLPAGPGVVPPAAGPGRFIRGALTAVIFDGGDPSENLRSNRKDLQSPIDNTKSGIVNFGTESPNFPPSSGVLSDAGTISGGANNQILEESAFSVIAGGLSNTVGPNALVSSIGGGATNQVTGLFSYAAGLANSVSGDESTAFGAGCVAGPGNQTFAAGNGAQAIGDESDAFARAITFGAGSFAASLATTGPDATASAAFNQGQATALAELSFAEGSGITTNIAAHAEGENTTAAGVDSHAEGQLTLASGFVSHAEGTENTASGDASHVEGQFNVADAVLSHIEGQANTSIAGDFVTTFGGSASHTEGVLARARFGVSHVHGLIFTTNLTQGQGQNTDVGLFGISAAGAPVDLSVAALGTTLNDTEIHLEDDQVYKFKVELVAHNRDAVTNASATKWAEWDFSFLAFMVGGVATVTGAPAAAAPDNESPGGSGWTITVTAVGDIVRFTFTGAAADATVQALAYVHFLELGNQNF